MPPFLQVVAWSSVANMTAALTKPALSPSLPAGTFINDFPQQDLLPRVVPRKAGNIFPFRKCAITPRRMSLCLDESDLVRLRFRRADALSACHAPDYPRQDRRISWDENMTSLMW